MRKIAADSGPLIALFDRDDSQHGRVLRFFESYQGRVYTTWPVMTEVSHLLGFSVDTQLNFLNWVKRGGVSVVELPEAALAQLIDLMAKYRDRPMDLADASLMLLAMETGIRDIISLDSDFDFYRLPNKARLNNLLTKRER